MALVVCLLSIILILSLFMGNNLKEKYVDTKFGSYGPMTSACSGNDPCKDCGDRADPSLSGNINTETEQAYRKFMDALDIYRINGHSMKYGNYPGPYDQPIQALKFNKGYKSTLKCGCNYKLNA